MILPVCQRGVQQIISQYNPLVPEVSLGTQKVATAKWNTRMFLMLFVVGQQERGGVPLNVEFCS